MGDSYNDYFDLVTALVLELGKELTNTSNCVQLTLSDNEILSIIKLPSSATLLLNDSVIHLNKETLPITFPTTSTKHKERISSIIDELRLKHTTKNIRGEFKEVPKEQEKVTPVTLPTRSSKSSRPNDMPDFDDEYEINPSHPHSNPITFPIGDSDLNPPGLPKHPSMKPWHDPLANPSGMHPSSSLFGDPSHNTSRRGVPPGARFDDPYGEDNLNDMGMGLPSGLRRGKPGNPPFGGPPGFGGNNSGGFNPPGFNDGFM